MPDLHLKQRSKFTSRSTKQGHHWEHKRSGRLAYTSS